MYAQKYKRNQEKHKLISKDVAFCCGYSGDRLGRFLRWASRLSLNALTDEAVTTSADWSFHIFTTLWLKVNLRRSSLNRPFLSFRGCPRSIAAFSSAFASQQYALIAMALLGDASTEQEGRIFRRGQAGPS